MTDTEVEKPAEQERSWGEARFASPDQRRVHSRHSVDLDVTVGSDHNFYGGLLENLSAGGVFIATHQIQPVGSEIDLTINVPDCPEPVRARGEVRWIRDYNERSNVPPGMGVRFIALEPGNAEMIEKFLAKRSPLLWDD